MNCIFCKIINGEIPAYKVYEDEKVLAFLDITQTTKGHTLVVPKKHVKNVYEMDEQSMIAVHSVIPKLAKATNEAFSPIGLNVLNNNDAPLQSVFHYHVHLIPRYEDDEFKINMPNNIDKLTKDQFVSAVESIQKALRNK